MEGYTQECEERDVEVSDMKAHIANCTAPKKVGNWTWQDFSKLQHITNVSERKLTMKEAKQSLGGKWREPNGK